MARTRPLCSEPTRSPESPEIARDCTSRSRSIAWRSDGKCAAAVLQACPFQEMRQGSPGGRASRQQTLLGNFTRWEPVSGERASQLARAGRTPSELGTMRFEGGAACGGGAVRRATLYFECGEQDALLEVTDVHLCTCGLAL